MTSRAWGCFLSLVATWGLVAYAAGCSEDTRTRTVPGPVVTVTAPAPPAPPEDPHVPPGEWRTTLGGTRWHCPAWLPSGSVLRASAEMEIDAAGVPSGWAVVAQDPGAFSLRGSPTGLATGATKFPEQTMHVAWAWPRQSGAPLFPALAHEVDHARSGNPCEGHPTCPLPAGGP